ncbi:MAG TPA: thymidylate synthase [Prolixibacteraceae bacterium]|nr:thymidylate synthase [Prolixibacteraceae bacterium]
MLNIPVITVSDKSLALAFEKAMVNLYEKGIRFKTQYDKPGDPESIDCTLNLTIEEPESEPMIHMAFPSGIEQLKEYVMELEGIKDHWVKNINDPDDTRWEYTYHGRLASYGTWMEKINGTSVEAGHFKIDQIEGVIRKLSEQPFTRQAQMITWMPNLDLDCFDPPCLQSLWYRILEDENGVYWLNCNIRFRSNDAWGASFMNMFGFIQFNKEIIAAGVSERTGKQVKLGRMNWQADSYHIYGRDIEQAREMLINRINDLSIEERTFSFSDDFIREMYDGAEAGILDKIKKYDSSH